MGASLARREEEGRGPGHTQKMTRSVAPTPHAYLLNEGEGVVDVVQAEGHHLREDAAADVGERHLDGADCKEGGGEGGF